MNGPLPTAPWATAAVDCVGVVFGDSIPSRPPAAYARNGAYRSLKCTCTVWLSTTVVPVYPTSAVIAPPGWKLGFTIRSRFHLTVFASNVAPSVKCTSCRSTNVNVRPSGDTR